MFELATRGMTPAQCRQWWDEHPEEWGNGDDLGPEIRIPIGKVRKHVLRKPRIDKFLFDDEEPREYYKQGHVGRAV